MEKTCSEAAPSANRADDNVVAIDRLRLMTDDEEHLVDRWQERGTTNDSLDQNGDPSADKSPPIDEDGDQLMYGTVEHEALQFVEEILRTDHCNAVPSHMWEFFQPFARRNKKQSVRIVENLLCKQEWFRSIGIDTHIDIGYHFTRKRNLEGIAKHGLLTRAELDDAKISVPFTKDTYGDGIYTTDNPFAYSDRGRVGIFVARLKGITSTRRRDLFANTVTKRPGFNSVVLLRESSQCMPLVYFPTWLLNWDEDQAPGNTAIHHYHCVLQKVVNDRLNDSPVPIVVVRVFPSSAPDRKKALFSVDSRPPPLLHLRFEAPEQLPPVEPFVFTSICLASADKGTSCPVCWEEFASSTPNSEGDDAKSIVRLNVCGHLYHRDCLTNALRTDHRCTVCRKQVSKPRGKMPTATLIVSQRPELQCEGHGKGVLELRYVLPRGVQKAYHPTPGKSHSQTKRTAYLPDNAQGRELLQRLAFAFAHGMTFAIGTSLTTGRDNVVVWGSIHHKTSLKPGHAHGYPDPDYLFRCNEELDALSVPKARDCAQELTELAALDANDQAPDCAQELTELAAPDANDQRKQSG